MSVLSRDPIRRRQELAARRIRGVGVAERTDGHAWGRLTSRQKEAYGSQRAFRGAMDASAERRAAQEAHAQGRQEAREDAEHQAEVWNRARGGGSMVPPAPPAQTEEQKRRAAQDATFKKMGGSEIPEAFAKASTADRSALLQRVNQDRMNARAANARAKYGQPPADNSIRPDSPRPSPTKPKQYNDWLAAARRRQTFRA